MCVCAQKKKIRFHSGQNVHTKIPVDIDLPFLNFITKIF